MLHPDGIVLPLPNGWRLEVLPMGEGSALNGEAMQVTVVSAGGEVVPMFGGSGISRAHSVVTHASELGRICAEATEHACGFASA